MAAILVLDLAGFWYFVRGILDLFGFALRILLTHRRCICGVRLVGQASSRVQSLQRLAVCSGVMPNHGKPRPNKWALGPLGRGSGDLLGAALGEAIVPSVVRALFQQLAGGQDMQTQHSQPFSSQRLQQPHRSQQQQQQQQWGGGGGGGRGGGGSTSEPKQGEWACVYGVKTNRARRQSCYKCGAARPPSTTTQAQGKRTSPEAVTAKPTPKAGAPSITEGGGDSACDDGQAEELVLDQTITDMITKVHKMISCPSKSAAVKMAATTAGDDDLELIEDGGSPKDILTQDEVKLYRALQETASGKRAEEATKYLRAHERAMTAREALRPVEDIQLIGLQPSQVLPRVEAQLVELQRQQADDAARWAKKETDDAAAADELEAKLEARTKAYSEKLEEVRTARKTERAKWAAAHAEQRDRVEAKITEVLKLREKAKSNPSALVVDPKAVTATKVEEDVVMAADNAAAAPGSAKPTQAVGAVTTVRPLAALPEVDIKDEAQLARLAKAQAVIDQASQQDAHVDLALRDLGLSAMEVKVLVGAAVWDEKYPDQAAQPQDDWPLPKRIVALVGKAVSRIEVSTVMAQTAQKAAAEALAEATAQGKAWQPVGNGGRAKPY